MTESRRGLEDVDSSGIDPEAQERVERFKQAIDAIAAGREAMGEFAGRSGISWEFSFYNSKFTLIPRTPIEVTPHSEKGMMPSTYPLGDAVETADPIVLSSLSIEGLDDRTGLTLVRGRTSSDQNGNFSSVLFAPSEHTIAIEVTEETDQGRDLE